MAYTVGTGFFLVPFLFIFWACVCYASKTVVAATVATSMALHFFSTAYIINSRRLRTQAEMGEKHIDVE